MGSPWVGLRSCYRKGGRFWGKKRLFVILSRVERRLFQFFRLLTKDEMPQAMG